LLRYQGLAVEYYGCAPECLANERIRRVKNPGKSEYLSEEFERMLKALIRSLEFKPLDPSILEPSSPTKLEKNHKYV
jgi:hypothetical protein